MKKKKAASPPIRILIVHGPNLNLLGEREPEIYGTFSLSELNAGLKKFARVRRVSLKIFQSNCEGALIDFIHLNRKWAQGLVINPAAYTHYSYAIRDAISAVAIPAVEVHLSDIGSREKFRQTSVIKPVCIGAFSGHGKKSYQDGLDFLLQTLPLLNEKRQS